MCSRGLWLEVQGPLEPGSCCVYPYTQLHADQMNPYIIPRTTAFRRDAHKSMQLFLCHSQFQRDPASWEAAQQKLLNADRRPSFASQNPSFEGVCMGNRKTCTCGAPFFS